MKNNKRRLLKDLPFGGLKAGEVVWRGGRGHGGNYSVSSFDTYYSEGGSSDNGIKAFEDNEENILDEIWDNKEWFEDADLKHINFVLNSDGILLKFKPIDREEIEKLARGLIHILPELKKGNYVWNEFKEITTSIKS